MSEINKDFDFRELIKKAMNVKPFIKPTTSLEFDIESIYIWYLIPRLSLFGNYMDFHMSIDFLCFRLNIRLCPNIFQSPMEYDYFSTPYFTYQYYQRKEFPHQIEMGWLGWFYRYCFGGKTPEKIPKYHRTGKFVKSFDDIES